MKPERTRLRTLTLKERRHAVGIEVIANVLLIVLVPLFVRATARYSFPGLFRLGLSDLAGTLGGSPGTTDVGWEVAAARALADRSVSAYANLTTIAPLIGMPGNDSLSVSHPPTSLPLSLPIAFLPYSLWIGMWVVAMVSALALSMRLLAVPASIAYPVALGLALTLPGQNAIATTYPLMAAGLALAWRFREHSLVAGLSYALLTASRGIAGVMLLYPLIRRQWRLIFIAALSLVLLLMVALALEPGVLEGFMHEGRDTIIRNTQREIVTPAALLSYVGIPNWVTWSLCLAVFGVALRARQSLFWVTAWLSFSLSPIAWPQSFVMVVPLAVVIWRSGRLGMTLMLVSAIPLVADIQASTRGASIVWPVFIVLSAVALILCPLREGPSTGATSVFLLGAGPFRSGEGQSIYGASASSA